MRRDLVEAARRGDHEAFEVLATSAGDRLYAVARLILRSADLAEDAVQEALVRAWQQLPSLRDPDRFDAWLYRLVVNACADQGRQLRRWSQQVRPLPVEPSIGDDTKSVADREQLERGFSRLKPEQRAVVVLHYYSGFSAAEIAHMLGIPEGTARSRLHYATEAMRAALEADARQPAVAQNRTA
ncbi:MAG: RNA polymerase sigma factor [Chloroflexi bacterium]|nr:RNA polymerase sigma factor [Chloroflexota bacterium]